MHPSNCSSFPNRLCYQFRIEPPCDFCLFLLHIVFAWRPWAWKWPSTLHFPPGRCLFISVPLNAHVEAGQPWGQEPHENASMDILTLSQASFQALPICTSLHMLLAAHFSVIWPLIFPSHFHLVLLLHEQTTPNGLITIQVACAGLTPHFGG